MDDLISRQAAIDAINRLDIPEDMCVFEILSHIELELGTLPSAQPEQRWIPCSERLPEDIRPVIVTWKNTDPKSYYQYIVGKHFMGTACYKNGKWYWYSSTTEDMLAEYGRYDSEEFDEAIECIAWMPLPEPYKIFTDNEKVCNGCHYNDGGVHAECIVCDKEKNRKEFGDKDDSAIPAHWIGQGHKIFKCSNCGNYLDFRGVNAGRGTANYCPNCGAKMWNIWMRKPQKLTKREEEIRTFEYALKRWLDMEHDEKILNDLEKKYLSAVIKPFRDRVDFICKANAIEHYGSQRIDIALTDESIDIGLPIFESGTMYKGMELGKEYTLEELGL